MKKSDDRINQEVADLVSQASALLQNVSRRDSQIDGDKVAEVAAWVTRLGQVIRKLYGPNSQHFANYNAALETRNFYILHSNHYEYLAQLAGIATAIAHDLEYGLLADLRGLVQAEVFSDFLEMGEHLLNEGYKDASAVIIGSVLEDGLRNLAISNQIPIYKENGKPLSLEPLNTELAKNDIYSKLTQKQVTSWGHIRNKAAHGEFDEYTSDQVQMMLLFVQSFSAEHLS